MTIVQPIRTTGTTPVVPLAKTEVARPRVHDRLDSITAPCVVVCAPAGSGKSIEVSSWARDRLTGTLVWVDAGDARDSAGRLWAAVLDGLRESLPAHAPALAPIAAVARRAPQEVPARLARWSQSLDQEVVVVVDDVHEIVDATIHEQLVELLAAGPRMRLVIVTRHDPPWPLHRMRLDGLVDEVRAADLAFDGVEAAALFADAGVELGQGEVDEIVQRTQGWAAGLRLAAMGASAAGDGPAFVREVSGRQEYIADYLTREVFDALDSPWQDFIGRIGTVDEVCAELAEALGGGADSAARLRDLTRRNAFIREQVDRPGWYCLHPLLLDFLRSRITDRAREGQLHRRAARWYADQGDAWSALEHAIDAQDWELAAELIGHHVVRWTVRNPPGDLRAMLRDVPREALLTHAGLALGVSASLTMSGSVEGVGELLAAVRARLPEAPAEQQPRLRLLADLIRIGVSRFVGDLRSLADTCLDLPVASEDLIPLELTDWTLVQALVLGNAGSAELWLGDLTAAQVHLDRAVREDGSRGVSLPALNARGHLAYLYWLRGELDDAETAARTVVDQLRTLGIGDAVQATAAHLALAGIATDRDRPDEARQRLDEALQCPAEPHTTFAASLLSARLAALDGRPFEAITALRTGREATSAGPVPSFLLDRSRGLEAHLQRLSGNDAEAELLTAPTGTDEPVTRRHDDRRVLIQRHVGRARMAAAAGAIESALVDLEVALGHAAPVDFRSPFVEAAPRLVGLLGTRIERGTAHVDFALDLLGRMADPSLASRPAGTLLVPLSERELNVLRHLVTNLSVPEIAAKLYVSVNTVKTHQRSIYRKLAASSRREAVDHARTVGLV